MVLYTFPFDSRIRVCTSYSRGYTCFTSSYCTDYHLPYHCQPLPSPQITITTPDLVITTVSCKSGYYHSSTAWRADETQCISVRRGRRLPAVQLRVKAAVAHRRRRRRLHSCEAGQKKTEERGSVSKSETGILLNWYYHGICG